MQKNSALVWRDSSAKLPLKIYEYVSERKRFMASTRDLVFHCCSCLKLFSVLKFLHAYCIVLPTPEDDAGVCIYRRNMYLCNFHVKSCVLTKYVGNNNSNYEGSEMKCDWSINNSFVLSVTVITWLTPLGNRYHQGLHHVYASKWKIFKVKLSNV